jgi:hypothetical protein
LQYAHAFVYDIAMKLYNQNGVSKLIIPVILLALTTLLGAGASIYYYSQFSDATNNLNAKIAEAVETAKKTQGEELEAAYIEREKEPRREYASPSVLSNIKFSYPKTWSGMVDENERAATQINGTFHPKIIETANAGSRSYAFNIKLVDALYPESVAKFDNQVQKGDLNASSITVANVQGVRLDGQITPDDRGSIIVLPIRDKTLVLTTESEQYLADFNQIVDSLSFAQ